MPEAGSTTPGPHVMCIISSQRDTYCYESKNDSSTNRSTWSEGLNIEIKIITPNYFKARCKTMTASWRGLRRIDNSELSTTLNSCFNMASLSRLIWQLIVYAIATSKPFPNKRAKPELNPGLTRVKRCGIGTGLKVGLSAYRASFWWKKPTFNPLFV